MRNDRRMDRRRDTGGKNRGSDSTGLKGAIYIAVFLLILRNNCIFCNNKNI